MRPRPCRKEVTLRRPCAHRYEPDSDDDVDLGDLDPDSAFGAAAAAPPNAAPSEPK